MSLSQIPNPRTFTQADGRINFRECLSAGREFWSRRNFRNLAGSRMSLPDWRYVRDKLADLVMAENARWAALPPATRAAATRFDIALAVRSIECFDYFGRETAIDALLNDRPAVWLNSSDGRNNPWTSLINWNVSGIAGEASSATVFDRLVSEDRDFTANLFALNAAGEQFLRNIRAARDYRKRPMLAAE